MRPRPRSRRKGLEYVPPAELLAEIAEVRARSIEPVAIVVGTREWHITRQQREAWPYLSGVSNEELAFDGVSVIVSRRHARAQVLADQDDLQEALYRP